MHILGRGAILLGLLLVLGCSSPQRARPDEFTEPDGVLVDASAVAELLDAIQSELVVENLCKGGEQLRLALLAESDDLGVVCLYYSVPDVLTVSREAYIQRDGLVLLADDLFYRDFETRSSTKPIDQEAFERVFQSAATRISCRIDGELTKVQLARHRERIRRKQEALAQP